MHTIPANPVDPNPMSESGLRMLLIAALDEEVELLDSLRKIFSGQREALATGDPLALDDGVFAATRVMRTMDEARRRRRSLTIKLLGSEIDFDELDTVLTGSQNRPIRVARERVRVAATRLREEVATLRRILQVALRDNRVYLETLLGAGVHKATSEAAYGGAEAVQEAGESGAVLDRTL